MRCAEQHRAAAIAAVDLTNLVVNPGTRVPAHNVFTHSKQPTTRDLAGNSIDTGRHAYLREKEHLSSYYDNLQGMSPAAPAAPSETRSYASSVASKAPTNATTTPVPSVYSTPRGEMTPSKINDASTSAAAQARVAHSMEFDQLCRDLASAIQAEDFSRANRLKAKRDELRNRALEHSVVTQSAATPMSNPSGGSVRSPNSSAPRASQARAESGGLGFLFTVWSHNPVHTPQPDTCHA